MSHTLRPGRDSDGPELIALVAAIYAEYPKCYLDVDNEAPEWRHIATSFEQWQGRFWVAEREGKVVGCVGITPAKRAGGCELKKLYVAKSERRQGLASRLLELVENEARARQASFVDLWSDTKFEPAHLFYERHGYTRSGETRELHDISDTVEYYFCKDLT